MMWIGLILVFVLIWVWIFYEIKNAPYVDADGNIITKKKIKINKTLTPEIL